MTSLDDSRSHSRSHLSKDSSSSRASKVGSLGPESDSVPAPCDGVLLQLADGDCFFFLATGVLGPVTMIDNGTSEALAGTSPLDAKALEELLEKCSEYGAALHVAERAPELQRQLSEHSMEHHTLARETLEELVDMVETDKVAQKLSKEEQHLVVVAKRLLALMKLSDNRPEEAREDLLRLLPNPDTDRREIDAVRLGKYESVEGDEQEDAAHSPAVCLQLSDLYEALGRVYDCLGELVVAWHLLEKALKLRTAARGATPIHRASVLTRLGSVAGRRGDLQMALRYYTQAHKLVDKSATVTARSSAVASVRQRLTSAMVERGLAQLEALGGEVEQSHERLGRVVAQLQEPPQLHHGLVFAQVDRADVVLTFFPLVRVEDEGVEQQLDQAVECLSGHEALISLRHLSTARRLRSKLWARMVTERKQEDDATREALLERCYQDAQASVEAARKAAPFQHAHAMSCMALAKAAGLRDDDDAEVQVHLEEALRMFATDADGTLKFRKCSATFKIQLASRYAALKEPDWKRWWGCADAIRSDQSSGRLTPNAALVLAQVLVQMCLRCRVDLETKLSSAQAKSDVLLLMRTLELEMWAFDVLTKAGWDPDQVAQPLRDEEAQMVQACRRLAVAGTFPSKRDSVPFFKALLRRYDARDPRTERAQVLYSLGNALVDEYDATKGPPALAEASQHFGEVHRLLTANYPLWLEALGKLAWCELEQGRKGIVPYLNDLVVGGAEYVRVPLRSKVRELTKDFPDAGLAVVEEETSASSAFCVIS